jgi:hypothetical protein
MCYRVCCANMMWSNRLKRTSGLSKKDESRATAENDDNGGRQETYVVPLINALGSFAIVDVEEGRLCSHASMMPCLYLCLCFVLVPVAVGTSTVLLWLLPNNVLTPSCKPRDNALFDELDASPIGWQRFWRKHERNSDSHVKMYFN